MVTVVGWRIRRIVRFYTAVIILTFKGRYKINPFGVFNFPCGCILRYIYTTYSGWRTSGKGLLEVLRKTAGLTVIILLCVFI